MFEELDTVELTHDIKDHKLKEGDMGAVVNVYSHGKAYEVEFVEPNGRTKALLTLVPNDICPYIDKTDIFPWNPKMPVYVTNSGITSNRFTDYNIIRADEARIKTETRESKANMKEFPYPIASV